jgi:hypothetical protein
MPPVEGLISARGPCHNKCGRTFGITFEAMARDTICFLARVVGGPA